MTCGDGAGQGSLVSFQSASIAKEISSIIILKVSRAARRSSRCAAARWTEDVAAAALVLIPGVSDDLRRRGGSGNVGKFFFRT